MSQYDLSPLMHRLSYGGVWIRGGEINTLPPTVFEDSDFKTLFVRLSTYFDTGYSFTHQLLYQLAGGLSGVYPDLAYLPPPKDAEIFNENKIPWLLGTQSKHGPYSFDLIGFSNSIVQELVNLPHFLVRSQIPLKKSERMERHDVPLLLLGGANALYSSSIWESDPMVDLVFVGESDEAIKQIILICQKAKKEGLHKREWIEKLLEVPGTFEPDKPRPTRKAFIWSLNKSEALANGPVYYLEDQVGKGHLQISEGCPCFCSFCAESWDRKPYREKSQSHLVESALKMKALMGLDTIELYSFNFNMHSDFYGVLWELVPYFRKIGLKSQRFDLLAHDPEMIQFQHAIEKASITCGLEGISPRIRKYLHKNLENHELHTSLRAIFESRARELKVFLIATGLEETVDFVALRDLLDHLKKIRDEVSAYTRIIFSMTPLVRFPWTPLEFEDAYPIAHYEKIIKKTASTIRQAGFEFRESADLPEYWVSQILVRADQPKVAAALRDAVFKTQFVYYREIPYFFQKALEEALIRRGLDPVSMLQGYSLEESYAKPWAQIETGVKRPFLWEEVERARKYSEIDYCLGRAWQESKCFLCGGCPSPEHILNIVKTKQTRNYSLEDLQARVKRHRNDEVSVPLLVDVKEKGAGIPRKLVAVRLARALMLADETLLKGYRGYSGSFWDSTNGPCIVEGEDSLVLLWSQVAATRLENLLTQKTFIQAINSSLDDWASLKGVTPQEWKPNSIFFQGQFDFAAEAFGKSKGLKYTIRKRNGETHYELATQSLKKKIISGIRLNQERNLLSIEPGSKFALKEFIHDGIQSVDSSSSARFRCFCNELPVSG